MPRTHWPRLLSAALLLWLALTPPVRAQPVPAPPAEAARGQTAFLTTDFSLALLDRLWQQPGNLLVSPYSLYAALLMLSSGAGGETATALGRVLRTPATGNDLEAFAREAARLTRPSSGSQVAMAQSLWPAKQFTLRPDFRRTMASTFGASITPLDYAGDAEGAARRINAWVSERTRGRITDLVTAEQFSSDMRLSLVSSLWFKGEWPVPFDTEATRTGPFHLEGGGTKAVPLMRRVDRLRLGTIPGGRILEIPYRGQTWETTDHSLLILLPDRHDGLTALQHQLTSQRLEQVIEGMKDTQVDLALPRFRMRARPDLMHTLERMGLGSVFRPGADLSRISPDPGLILSSVMQEAMLRVDENGTEAAAATLMAMPVLGLSEDPLTPFHVDHPFLVMIRDQPSGTLLFVGRVMEPGDQP